MEATKISDAEVKKMVIRMLRDLLSENLKR